jgi:DNA-binding LytR/AlgR family response regulator
MKLTEIERRLAAAGFARIHRSRLVNLARVKEFRPLSRGTSIVVMRNGTRLDASYSCLREIQERAAGGQLRSAGATFDKT